MTDLAIVCWLWSDPARQRSYIYGREDVRILSDMLKRNVTVPYRLICATHLPHLVDDIVDVVPLLVEKHVPGLCTIKLMAWHPEAERIFGAKRILSLDLDCIITDNIDRLLLREEEVLMWANPNYSVNGRRSFYQGSFQLLTAGARSYIWEDFDPRSTPAFLNRRFGGGEQAWLGERFSLAWPEPGWEWGEAYLTEADGIYGAGRLVNGRMGAGVQSELPGNARIVFFPGNRNPAQPEVRNAHPWIDEYYHA